MPVIVDYDICDSVEGCPAVMICDAGALYYDNSSGRVQYDRDRCRDCGTCANYCAPAAVMHAATEEEWQELKQMLRG
ncbi:MAG: hypothetical protein M1401_03210 [Chloroflexi bacterium]|nr:hypothetical protein [Chloroflexota bacterium]MCL5107877.1 hypothetical protein [Chloroflexota bacterium]